MFFNVKGTLIVLAVIVVVMCVCALDLHCSRRPTAESTISRVKGELAAGQREVRYQQAEDLARLARDLRVLARHHVAKGEKRKAQRALAAAQELDGKIRKLRGEK